MSRPPLRDLIEAYAMLTPDEQERANRIAQLIGSESGGAMGSGLELLVRAEGRDAAQADVIAMLDSIERLIAIVPRRRPNSSSS